MDISFKLDNRKFNYCVCALFIHDGRILAMHDERSPYFSTFPAAEWNWGKEPRMPS